MNIKHIIVVVFASFMLSGCVTAILFAGSAVGLGYVAQDVNENYNGDVEYFMEDKYNKLTDGY